MKEIVEYINKECESLEEKQISYGIGLLYKDKIIFEKYSGYANIEHKVKISKDTVFPVSSLTKQFTAMTIILTFEEGLIKYNDLVKEYLEDFPIDKLTVKHLLHQVSGLIDPYTYFEDNRLNSYDINNEIIYNLLKENKLSFNIGEKFDYCNSNYILLAMIIEKIYGKSFKNVLKEKIFIPLGMKNSDLFDSRLIIHNRAYGYKIDEEVTTVDNMWLSYGDGGIVSTVNDLVKWSKSILNYKLVSKKSLDIAFTSGKTNEGEDTNYGFGWVINKVNDNLILRHAGGDSGFGSFISIIPNDFSIILLSNTDNSWMEFNSIVKRIEDMICNDN